ncbi:MAG: glutathione S-transferase N-terminal domain-containing protein [Proteobacteria bacterium]|nr:glutathione S-transferase N-terminal domain-containing protein [Pseudomonadota bacterium]
MRLYFSTTSPYVRKVRVVALELGQPLDLEPVAVHDLTNSDYGKINPVNRIPALMTDDVGLIFDSRVICEYLDARAGGGVLPAAGPARWAVLRRQALGDGLMDAAVPRMAERNRPPAQQNPSRLAEYERSQRQILDALEAEVDALAGLDLGVIAVACALAYQDFRFADEPWRPTRPRLAAWYDAFAQRPSMTQTRPDAPSA